MTPPRPGRMRRVILESPYAGDVEENLRYLRACMRDSLLRGEAPFASHALYTQPGVLDDLVPDERNLGIDAGFEWRASAHATVFYIDRGWSSGMRRGLAHAVRVGHPVEARTLEGYDAPTPCVCGRTVVGGSCGDPYCNVPAR